MKIVFFFSLAVFMLLYAVLQGLSIQIKRVESDVVELSRRAAEKE